MFPIRKKSFANPQQEISSRLKVSTPTPATNMPNTPFVPVDGGYDKYKGIVDPGYGFRPIDIKEYPPPDTSYKSQPNFSSGTRDDAMKAASNMADNQILKSSMGNMSDNQILKSPMRNMKKGGSIKTTKISTHEKNSKHKDCW